MVHRQSKTAKRSATQNKKRENESEVYSDGAARNLMASTPKLTPKKEKRAPSKEAIKKREAKIRLYGATNGTKYSETQLAVPQLNMAVTPGVKAKRGKKGKVFVDDHDSLLMNRLVKSINDKYDSVNESKLEKSKRLEDLRALKRQELERKEQAKQDKLEGKKSELRSKASVARAARRKSAKARRKEEEGDGDDDNESAPKRKKVSFA
ncbi:hypothetical protein DIURU_004018 [Diutina rugosa]|uniref:60S ribosomal subunit assembly/export protein LOC1 n=1 Tax=Diutina rugosa TaxID=5481 RepID=A0A642UJ28_DIURU|nr:uncharacterized protein DIURU_004018 [Diutina rugosa]KAA8899977.1 hypothetical protein DIURU_004018 [Diutina rugosa]